MVRVKRGKKRQYRRLWITRINAGLLNHNLSYSKFIYLLKKSKISLNRKILSQIMILDYQAFERIVDNVF